MDQLNRSVSPVIAGVWIVVLACLALIVVDDVRLRTKVAALSIALDRTTEVALGPTPGAITATGPTGDGVVIDGDETTIVFVASFSCPFCRAGMPTWRGLASGLPKARVVLLRVEGTKPAGSAMDGGRYGAAAFAFPDRPELRWMTPNDSTRAAYRLGYVPQTMVVKKGQVLFVRTGALTEADVANIRKAAL